MSYSGVSSGRRRFLTGAVSVVGAVGAGFTAVPFVVSWEPSARARAFGAPVEFDIDKLEPGQRVVVKWRGKPVWVVRRSRTALQSLVADEEQLRDPGSQEDMQPEYARNQSRAINPEYLILVGICTHLGCSPVFVKPGDGGPFDLSADWSGFFCPCHGSKFDLAGRVYKGVPAPLNLEVPPHRYLSQSRIEIGVDQNGGAA